MVVVANPRQFKIPDWFLNRQKDYKDGKFSQVTSNALDMKLRDDLERLKKIRLVFYFSTLLLTCHVLLEILNQLLLVQVVGKPFLSVLILYFTIWWWQESSWFASLLGSSSAWSAHKDHWSPGEDCWCLQEAIVTFPGTNFACFMLYHFHMRQEGLNGLSFMILLNVLDWVLWSSIAFEGCVIYLSSFVTDEVQFSTPLMVFVWYLSRGKFSIFLVP